MRPDLQDQGTPVIVAVGDVLLGDLGHRRVDARLVHAVALRDGPVARWLATHGVTPATLAAALPEGRWPLDPPPDTPAAVVPDATDPLTPIALRLGHEPLGPLGEPSTDARALLAVTLRGSAVAAWLAGRAVTTAALREAFPDATA